MCSLQREGGNETSPFAGELNLFYSSVLLCIDKKGTPISLFVFLLAVSSRDSASMAAAGIDPLVRSAPLTSALTQTIYPNDLSIVWLQRNICSPKLFVISIYRSHLPSANFKAAGVSYQLLL